MVTIGNKGCLTIESKHVNSDTFLSRLKVKTLRTIQHVKIHHSGKNFVPKQQHFKTKDLSLFKVLSFLFLNLVAMTTVKISFVVFSHAKISVCQFQNITYLNNREMVDLL